MAKTRIPNPLEQRHQIVKDLPEAQARQLAEAYREAGRQAEAAQFFAKAGAADELEAMAAEAISTGNAFLLKLVSEALEKEPSADDWRRLGDAARAAGKERYAVLAARQADVALG